MITGLGQPPELADRPEPSGEVIYEIFEIETYPLERVTDAWERQAAGANAKIVVMLP